MSSLEGVLNDIFYKISPTQNIFTDLLFIGVWLGVFIAASIVIAIAVFIAKLIAKRFFANTY